MSVLGLVGPRNTFAGESASLRVREAQAAIKHLLEFPSKQNLLSPEPSCGWSEDSEEESSIDYSEESCSITPTHQSPMEIASRLATKLKSLPGPVGGYLSKLIQDYEQVLQPKSYGHLRVGDGNFGLASYLVQNFKSDPELLRSAQGFYSEISQRDLRAPEKRRPTIQDHVANEERGWVWKLALQYTKNDPVKAMRVIGLCGHDDTYQLGDDSLEGLPFSEAEKKAEFQSQLRDYQRVIAFLRSEKKQLLTHSSSDPDYRQRLNQMNQDLAENESSLKSLIAKGPKGITLKHQFFCPAKDSVFYLPGGLGVDVSEQMKARVVHDQSSSVAAKYYHVYGSALVACELVHRGHSPVLVAQLQKLLGWAYRAQRFNT
ncbi:MAG: hypothetical protein KGQ59_12365, partial [Bdellovibrionales bacterium]|nr:hypothetical protein [Bdellovibrionales bacterium]